MGVGIACMAGVVALWSTVPVLVKLLLPVFDPFAIAFLRLAQGAAVVLVVHLLRGHGLGDLRVGGWHVIGGLGASLNYALFALGLSFTTASAGVLIVQVQYVTLALLAAVVLHERFTPAKIAGMTLVLGGVGLVLGLRGAVSLVLAPRYVLGNGLMVFSGIGWGVYALSNKALASGAGTSRILLPMLTIATAVTGVLAVPHLAPRTPLTARTWAIVLAVGVVATGGAFLLVSEAMRRVSAALAGSTTAVTPVAQIVLAVVLLGEPLSPGLMGGGAMILGGVLAIALDERRRRLPAPMSGAMTGE